MTVFVVDTNVAVAANGRMTHASIECQLRCVETLQLIRGQMIAIDSSGLVIKEYRNQLSFSGAPGVGDAFSKYVFDNQYRDDKIQRVEVTPSDNDKRGFEELPENTFDRSDRKFLAVAVAADAVVLNATDSDWSQHETLMDRLGVVVEELCPQHIAGANV